MNSVTKSQKKVFLAKFITQHQFNLRGVSWIFNYLINNDYLLDKIRFVRNAKEYPTYMIISATCSKTVPFLFYFNHATTTDIETAFSYIRTEFSSDIYLQLNFKNSLQSPEWIAILEEDDEPNSFHLTREEQFYVDSFLNESLINFKKEKLLKQIDECLDKKDEKLFYLLIEQFKKL